MQPRCLPFLLKNPFLQMDHQHHQKQAEEIAADLNSSGIKVEADVEIIALIAYLHRMGRDISEGNNETEKVEETVAIEVPEMKMDEATLAEGMALYTTNCLACHGASGEGNAIGPNLTDNFFISGGTDEAIYTAIHSGIPAKGMQAWTGTLSPTDLAKVTSYTISLIGTNPENAKAEQGELFERK